MFTFSIGVFFFVHCVYLLLQPCRAPPRIRRRLLSRLLTSASRTTGFARVTGLGALLTAAGIDDEEDADFSHPLGSAAAAPASRSFYRNVPVSWINL